MLTYVLDASAYLRFVLDEAGGPHVRDILQQQKAGTAKAIMSAVQWGEVVKVVTLREGEETPSQLASYLRTIGFEIVDVTAARAHDSALLGIKYKLSYADAFGVELASATDHILVTADYGVKPAEAAIRIEFLPPKQRTPTPAVAP